MGTVEVIDDFTRVKPILLNPAAIRSIGVVNPYSPSSIPPELANLWISKYKEVVRTGKPLSFSTAEEYQLQSPLQFSICCMIDVGDNKFSFLSQDITNQKKVAEQLIFGKQFLLEKSIQSRIEELEHALQAKSRFLAIMSHGKIFLYCDNF